MERDWTKEFQPSWINDKITCETIVFAEEFAKDLCKKESHKDDKGRSVIDKEPMTTSQVRKFFGEVKRQQMAEFNESKFVMLKPKLAYAVGRQKKNGKGNTQKIEVFYVVISKAIDTVLNCSTKEEKEKAFRNFIYFFEATVAYHKKYDTSKE